MKRFLTTILSILYMSSALCLTVHVHYCMGKFAGVGFTHNDEGRCGKCGMKKIERSKGCCKDDQKTFKTNDHQQAKAFNFSHKLIVVAQLPSYPSFSEVPIFLGVEITSRANSPPVLWRTLPIYILNQDFRI